MNTRLMIGSAAAAACLLAIGCKGSPASPFNTLQDSPVTVYRLQNYEAQAQSTTPAQPGTSIIPGLPIPPEFQTQVQQAQNMVCSFLPPGSPGCPAAGQTGTATPAVDSGRFEGFRIIGQAQVMDPKIRTQIIDALGYESNYTSKKSPCMFAELGFSFQGPNPPPDVLVSFSCNQVQARNFTWPFAENGMKEDTVKKFSAIIQQLFGGG